MASMQKIRRRIKWDMHGKQLPWQRRVYAQRKRFNILAKGRRTGGSSLCEDIACERLFGGGDVGWFSATNKILKDSERTLFDALRAPNLLRDWNRQESYYKLHNGSVMEMWSFESKLPGRAREYSLVVVDEAAHIPGLLDFFNRGIRPGLAKTRGTAWMPSSPNGMGDYKTFWNRGRDHDFPDWACWQIPTWENPYIPASEIEEMRHELDTGAFDQEIGAQFVARAGSCFKDFKREIHVKDIEYNPDLPLYAGIDFGYRVSAIVLFQVTKSGVVCIIADAEYREMDTEAALLALQSSPIHGLPIDWYKRVAIIGCDPAGQGHRSEAPKGRTDMSIVRGAFPCSRVLGTYDPQFKSPESRASFVRGIIKSAAGDVRLHVAPWCKHSINWLENSVYPQHREGRDIGQEPVKDGIVDHSRDASEHGMIAAGIFGHVGARAESMAWL